MHARRNSVFLISNESSLDSTPMSTTTDEYFPQQDEIQVDSIDFIPFHFPILCRIHQFLI